LGRRWRAASLRRAAGYPGPTRTAHARRYSPDNSRENRRMPPETLAEHIFRAVERKQRVLIPSPANQAFALAGTWLPAITEAAMRQSIFEKLP
jgi:short-subunit dehydrogenase